MYYVYILKSGTNDEFYLGYTSNLDKRIKEHNAGNNLSTKHSKWDLVYYEAYTSKSFAMKRERTLKKNRRMYSFLINRVIESLK